MFVYGRLDQNECDADGCSCLCEIDTEDGDCKGRQTNLAYDLYLIINPTDPSKYI